MSFNKKKLADKPDSVVDSHSSRPSIARWLQQPTRSQREPRRTEPYLVLLRVEFTSPYTVASNAVRSYRTLSALPVSINTPSAVFSLLHLSSTFAAQALPGTLLYEVRTFLSLSNDKQRLSGQLLGRKFGQKPFKRQAKSESTRHKKSS